MSAAGLLAAALGRVFEHAPAMVVVLEGPEHVVRYANPAYLRLWGGRPLIGRSVHEALPEVEGAGLVTVLDHCWATAEPFTATAAPLQIPGEDGARVRYFDFVYQPIVAEDGTVEGMFGQGVDVTERVLAERTLRRVESLGAAVLSASLDAIVTIDQHSRVVEWNGGAERTFGFSAAQAIGRDLCELIIRPQDRSAHRTGMARYLATGEGPVIGRRVEVEAMTSTGRVIPVELAISPIHLEGEPHFTAYLRDISAQQAAEDGLRRSEERLRATYEHAFVGIGEVDAGGRFLRTNEHFSEITGFSPEELLARTIWDITHPEDAASERDIFQRQMAGELATYRREKRYLHKSGGVVWVELDASVVCDAAGGVAYGVRVVRDISDRRAWEERQRLLVNELNHRVKNTLATVQSIAAQTRRTVADPQAAYNAFVDRLVALSRSHDVLTREHWRGADLKAIVAEAVSPFEGELMQRFDVRGVSVWLSPQAALAFGMALHELGTNAVKYGALSAPAGRIKVEWRRSKTSVQLTWREEGGPPVGAPVREGFGTRLLRRGLASDLGGEVELEYRPDGLVCTVQAELTDIPGGSGAGR